MSAAKTAKAVKKSKKAAPAKKVSAPAEQVTTIIQQVQGGAHCRAPVRFQCCGCGPREYELRWELESQITG